MAGSCRLGLSMSMLTVSVAVTSISLWCFEPDAERDAEGLPREPWIVTFEHESWIPEFPCPSPVAGLV